MFLSLKINKKTFIVLLCGILSIILLFVVDSAATSGNSSTNNNSSLITDGATNKQRVDFLSQFDWEINAEVIDCCDVVIPTEFDDVYINYNAIQISQGFDLQPYSGKLVTRWTYEVTNYPDGVEGVVANLLIYDGKVIGGDICTVAIDGFMHGFNLSLIST